MNSYFQEPIFLLAQPPGLLVVPAPQILVLTSPIPTTFQWAWATYYPWECVPLPQYDDFSKIRIKVIFYGTKARPGKPSSSGFWTAATDATYDTAPDRNTILANLSYWAKQEGLADRIYAGQAKMFLASTPRSTLTILPTGGPQNPGDLLQTIELRDDPPTVEFQRRIDDIRRRRLGAFLVVNMDAYEDYAAAPVPPPSALIVDGDGESHSLLGLEGGESVADEPATSQKSSIA